MADPIGVEALEAFAAAYKPPKGDPTMALETDSPTVEVKKKRAAGWAARSTTEWSRGNGQVLWYVPQLVEFEPEGEAEKASKSDQLAAKRIDPSLRDSRIDQLQVTPDTVADRRLAIFARRGDLIVTVTRSGTGWKVEPTGTVLVARRHGKGVGTLLTYALTSNRVAAPHPRFLSALANRGLSLAYRGTRTLAITDPSEIRSIVELASGKGLRALRATK